MAAKQKGAVDIGLEDLAHRGEGREKGVVHGGDPGIVDQVIEPAELFPDPAEEPLCFRLVGHVHLEMMVPGGLDL